MWLQREECEEPSRAAYLTVLCITTLNLPGLIQHNLKQCPYTIFWSSCPTGIHLTFRISSSFPKGKHRGGRFPSALRISLQLQLLGWEEHDSYLSYFLLPVKSRASLPAFSSCSLFHWECRHLGSSGEHSLPCWTSAHAGSAHHPAPAASPAAPSQIRYYKHHIRLSEMVAEQRWYLSWGLFLHGRRVPRQLRAYQVPAATVTLQLPPGQPRPLACKTVPRISGHLIRKHCRYAASQIRDYYNSPVSNSFLERNCSKLESTGTRKVKPCNP